MSLIYRIEHPTVMMNSCMGIGPAGAYSSCIAATYSPFNEVDYIGGDNHPAPYSDGLRCFDGLIFGFLRLADARRWFYSEGDLGRWNADGIRLAVWLSTASHNLVIGRSQVAFERPTCAPMYLPAYAIHQFTEETITDMAADFFPIQECPL